VLRKHVIDEAVAAEERGRIVRVWPYHRNARRLGQGQHCFVGQQDHRLLGERPRQIAVRAWIHIDVLDRLRLESGVEQPECLLLPQDAANCAVD
jgi:hypothetical protein